MKWGKADQIGALNEVTPQVLISALRLVKRGRVLNLAQTYENEMPTIWFHGPFFYSTFRTVDVTLKQFSEYSNKLGSTVCRYELSDHTGTHVDSLSHATVEYELYNGIDIRTIQTNAGTSKLGIETMPPVVTRGIILDFPDYFGTDILDDEYEITPSDIEGLAAKNRIDFRPGDAVLFRTGFDNLWIKDNTRYLDNAPGLGLKSARWLVKKRLGITGSDTASFDVVKKRTKLLFPCHQVLIKENGIHLMENLKLHELAKLGLREFVFVCTPLRIRGGAGSPVAPIAIY